MKSNSLKKTVVVFMVIICSFLASFDVHAADYYDAQASLKFAEENWDAQDGTLCAEYVSNCLKAGGVSAWSRSCTELRRQLINSGLGTEHEIILEADNSINMKKYAEVLKPGDVVFYYCPKCVDIDGKPYIHAVLCNGSSGNYMKAYAHNSANSGRRKYMYSSRCYACNESIDKAYVFSFKTDSVPIGCLDKLSGGNGTISLTGWTLDEDTPMDSIDIHIYVGAPAGTSGASCYVMKAEKERADVQKVYGLGSMHGFLDTIEVKERGEQEVYIYAINNDADGENPLIGSGTVYIEEPFIIEFEDETIDMQVEEETISFQFRGNGIYTMCVDIEDEGIVQAIAWENVSWTTGEAALKVKGLKSGKSRLKISLLDSNYNVLYEEAVNINVNGSNTNFTIDFVAEQIKVDLGESVLLPFTFRGDGIYTMAPYIEDEEVVKAVSWKSVDWTNGEAVLEVKGIKEGATNLELVLQDQNYNVLYSKSVNVVVNAMSSEEPIDEIQQTEEIISTQNEMDVYSEEVKIYIQKLRDYWKKYMY